MKVPVSPWAYRMWRNKTGQILVTLPQDGKKLNALISKYSELVVFIAFHLFVDQEPPLYHFEPVKHLDHGTTRSGKKFVNVIEDEGAITHFGLALFLSVADAFLITAEDIVAADGGKRWKQDNQNLLKGCL